MAPVVNISVYSRLFRVIRRWNIRQCRSVQSIIGATENSQPVDFILFLFICSYLHVVLEKPIDLQFIPILAHNRPTAHLAQLVVKRDGLIVHREARTFDRKQAAAAWLEKREGELATPGALEQLAIADPPLCEVIDRYITESKKAIGRTKAQVLRSIKGHDLATDGK